MSNEYTPPLGPIPHQKVIKDRNIKLSEALNAYCKSYWNYGTNLIDNRDILINIKRIANELICMCDTELELLQYEDTHDGIIYEIDKIASICNYKEENNE